MNVLLSIKPVFAEKILSGEKRYEFRKAPLTKVEDGDRVVLYASSPIQKLVGEFKVGRIIEGSPWELWERFQKEAGIEDREWFLDYFGDNNLGYAIEVGGVNRFEVPIDPYDLLDGFHPPVSFQYINGQLPIDLNDPSIYSSNQLVRSTCD